MLAVMGIIVDMVTGASTKSRKENAGDHIPAFSYCINELLIHAKYLAYHQSEDYGTIYEWDDKK